MVIPTDPPFTTIPDADVDPDSPLSTNLMTAIRDNIDFNNQWLGDKSNALPNHRHRGLLTDGTDKVAFGDLTGAPTFDIQTAVFDLSIDSGVTQVASTGVLGFTPKVVIVLGVVSNISGSSDASYSGFATGTGTAAKAIGHHVSGPGNNSGISIDSDAIGGSATNIGGVSTSFFRDLDVTKFLASEIEFTVSAPSSGVWTFKVLVIG